MFYLVQYFILQEQLYIYKGITICMGQNTYHKHVELIHICSIRVCLRLVYALQWTTAVDHFTDQSTCSTNLRYFTVTSSLAFIKSYPCESLVTSLFV